MKMMIWRIILVLMFGVGGLLFIYGLTDLHNGLNGSVSIAGTGVGYAGGFTWSRVGRYFMCAGIFMMSIPVAVRFTRQNLN